jgi:hypothetical protein
VKCTSCSEPVRPVVAIDIDGTLGDYHDHFLRFLEDYLGHSPIYPFQHNPKYGGDRPFREWVCEHYTIDARTFRDAKLAYRQGAMKRTMSPYPHAQMLCVTVRIWAELWITTTRPYLRLDNIDPDTREWLRRNGIEFDGLLYDEAKYERLAERVDPERVVAVVDDLPEMVEAAASRFGPAVPILRRTVWNRNVSWDGAEDGDLYHIMNMVSQRINDWRSQHE